MVVGGFAAYKCGFCELFAFFEDFEHSEHTNRSESLHTL